MSKEFQQIAWDDEVAHDWQSLLQLAVREDLGRLYDTTTLAVVPQHARAEAAVVARQPGVIAGLPAARMAVAECDRRLEWRPLVEDGQPVRPGQVVAELRGPARNLLTVERLMLNVLSRLSGIATLTRRYVDAVDGTGARIFDTRKTTPGWRRLEKYAVRQGGGWNHRARLCDAILIKDNHLAIARDSDDSTCRTPADAVRRAREFIAEMAPPSIAQQMIVEVEVDTLQQLEDVLAAGPDLVLLDNMSLETLKQAVAMRNAAAPAVELEASGGIRLENVRDVALTGVERISVGALTHAAEWFDVGLDYRGPLPSESGDSQTDAGSPPQSSS